MKYPYYTPAEKEALITQIQLYNAEVPETDPKPLLEYGYNVKPEDMSSIVSVAQQILDSKRDDKEKLYLLGILLTCNKNTYIRQLKKEFYHLQQKLKNQKIYIGKIINSYEECKTELKNVYTKLNKYRNPNYKPKNTYHNHNEDEIALQKAKAAYDKQFNSYNQPLQQPKKKIVIIKKKS